MKPEEILAHTGEGDPGDFITQARKQLESGNRKLAAAAYDLAFGQAPGNEEITRERNRLLDELAVQRCGISFRYVPAGSFIMGSDDGDPDERPMHRVQLDEFWISDTPISWDQANSLLGWGDPAQFLNRDKKWYKKRGLEFFPFLMGDQTRLQYCEDHTEGARDWHAHVPPTGKGSRQTAAMFGSPPRSKEAHYSYEKKPMVAVDFTLAEQVCEAASAWGMACRLPTEAEWEKAARGSLTGCYYPWGKDSAGPGNCDCNRLPKYAIRKSRTYPPNGYGFYATSGGVWEWTADWYDAQYYSVSPVESPRGPGEGMEKTLRGGSWADCPEVVTNSFRMSLPAGNGLSPNIGFRICVSEFGEIPAELPSSRPAKTPMVKEYGGLWKRLKGIFGK